MKFFEYEEGVTTAEDAFKFVLAHLAQQTTRAIDTASDRCKYQIFDGPELVNACAIGCLLPEEFPEFSQDFFTQTYAGVRNLLDRFADDATFPLRFLTDLLEVGYWGYLQTIHDRDFYRNFDDPSGLSSEGQAVANQIANDLGFEIPFPIIYFDPNQTAADFFNRQTTNW